MGLAVVSEAFPVYLRESILRQFPVEERLQNRERCAGWDDERRRWIRLHRGAQAIVKKRLQDRRRFRNLLPGRR